MRKNSPNYLSTIEVLRKIEHFKGMKDSELDEILERYSEGSKILYSEKKAIDIKRIIPIIKDERFVLEMQNLIGEFENKHLFEKYNSDL